MIRRCQSSLLNMWTYCIGLVIWICRAIVAAAFLASWICCDQLFCYFCRTEIYRIEMGALSINVSHFTWIESNWVLFKMFMEISRVSKFLLLVRWWLPCFRSKDFRHISTPTANTFYSLLKVLQLSLLVQNSWFLVLSCHMILKREFGAKSVIISWGISWCSKVLSQVWYRGWWSEHLWIASNDSSS